MNKVIIVVCEGKSERTYLQKLNRLLSENEIPLRFKGEDSEGGDFRAVNSCYRTCRKNNRKAPIVIWVDKDIYKRNDRGNRDAYENKSKGMPDFKFNYENFEDFLVMHLSEDKVRTWQILCNNNEHFSSPMHASTYVPLLQSTIFANYKKGALPEDLEIGQESLANLKHHNSDCKIPFHSDFADFMLNEIEQAK